MQISKTVVYTDDSITGMIRSYGVRRFARKIGVDPSNLTRTLNNKLIISEGKFNELKKQLYKIPVSEFSKNSGDSDTRNSKKHRTTS